MGRKTNFSQEPSWSAVMEFVHRHPGGATLEEVGDAFGVTRERVRQIESGALRKLALAMVVAMPDFVEPGWKPRFTRWLHGE
jgi:hypothetical protein